MITNIQLRLLGGGGGSSIVSSRSISTQNPSAPIDLDTRSVYSTERIIGIEIRLS